MSTPARVLIVEDDNAMAQMCAKLIRRRGHSAVIAGSSEDALAIVRGGGDVDVVISDVEMPLMTGVELLAGIRQIDDSLPIILMTGVELLAGIRQIDDSLPIILMTGYATVLSPLEAAELGATDYLMKPFDSETFLCSLERAIRKK